MELYENMLNPLMAPSFETYSQSLCKLNKLKVLYKYYAYSIYNVYIHTSTFDELS